MTRTVRSKVVSKGSDMLNSHPIVVGDQIVRVEPSLMGMFVIKNNTFVEIRDCMIISKNTN